MIILFCIAHIVSYLQTSVKLAFYSFDSVNSATSSNSNLKCHIFKRSYAWLTSFENYRIISSFHVITWRIDFLQFTNLHARKLDMLVIYSNLWRKRQIKKNKNKFYNGSYCIIDFFLFNFCHFLHIKPGHHA